MRYGNLEDGYPTFEGQNIRQNKQGILGSLLCS